MSHRHEIFILTHGVSLPMHYPREGRLASPRAFPLESEVIAKIGGGMRRLMQVRAVQEVLCSKGGISRRPVLHLAHSPNDTTLSDSERARNKQYLVHTRKVRPLLS